MAVRIPRDLQGDGAARQPHKQGARGLFQENPHKAEVKQLLKEGKTVAECCELFPEAVVARKTISRWKEQVEDEQAGRVPPGRRTGTPAVVMSGVSKEPFTPVGTPTPPPPEPVAQPQEWVYVGPIRMPVLDMSYSSSRNLFIVTDTFETAKREYNFPITMKMGDFLAELCQAFRMMRGWDVIGAGVYPVEIKREVHVK